MTMHSDSITGVNLPPHPHMPRGMDPTKFREDVESIVNDQLKLYDESRRRVDAEKTLEDRKKRWMVYGGSGMVGMAVGITSVLVTQRIRRGRGGGGTMAK